MNSYNIEIREFNGVDYDVLYPITKIQNVQGLQEELSNKFSFIVYTGILYKNQWEIITPSPDGIDEIRQSIPVQGVLNTDNITMRIAHFEETETSEEIHDKIVEYNKLIGAHASNNYITVFTSTYPSIDLSVIFFVFRSL